MLQSALGRSRQVDKGYKQQAFNSNWQAADLALGQGKHAALALKDNLADLTEQILQSYKSCAERNLNSGRGNFAFDLADQTSLFLSNMRAIADKQKQKDQIAAQAASALIEQSFDLLRSYAWEFNGFLAYPELHVTATKPAVVSEVLRYSIFREPLDTVSKLRARLSTRFYSLILRGHQDSVEFILMPAHKVIGLTTAEDIYEPFATFSLAIEDVKPVWQWEGQVLSDELLESICKRAFSTLIELSKESAS